jgi:preprotein translocase subunit SecG
MTLTTYLLIAQIVVAVALIAVVTMQVRGGGLGGIFGQPESVYRTRRGVEKSLFQFTIGLTVIFVVLCVWVVYIT